MRALAHLLVLIACLLWHVVGDKQVLGQYIVMLKDDSKTDLHSHIAWVNEINERDDNWYAGVQKYYNCPLGKGYFAQLSGRTALEVENSEDVLHVIPDTEISIASTPSVAKFKEDKKLHKNNWGLATISSNPPVRDGKGSFKYPDSEGTGTYIYIVDTGIQSEDREFGGRVVQGQPDVSETVYDELEDDLYHGTFVAGIAGGITHGVAKNATIVDVKIGKDHLFDLNESPKWNISNTDIVEGLCWASADIINRNRSKKAVINVSLEIGHLGCVGAQEIFWRLAEKNITVVVAAGNKGTNVNENCLASYPENIAVGAIDRQLDAADFSNWGIGVDIWAPGVDIRSILSYAVVKRFQGFWKRYPRDTYSGTSFAAPHVAGIIAGWMSESEEGLTSEEVKKKLKELSHKDMVGAGLLRKAGVPETECKYRLENNQMAYNGAG